MSPHHVHSTPRITVTCAILLLALMLSVPATALARDRPHPALFALSSADFPVGSHVVRAGIEGNRLLLRDQALHFDLPPATMGRLTGYYMDAVEGNPAAEPRPYTSYLVSIFRSPRRARSAYAIRWESWFAASYNTTPPSAPVTLGDTGMEALFHTLDPSRPPLSELLFVRGAVLIEVFQATVSAHPTDSERHAFWAIATELDALAGKHRRGA